MDGNLYLAEINVKKLICEILHLLKIKNEFDRYYTVNTVKAFLCENELEGYCNCLFKLAALSETNKSSVDAVVRELLELVIPHGEGENFFESLPSYFMEDVVTPGTADFNNIHVDNTTGRKLVFDTVHGVKGETHDVTLY